MPKLDIEISPASFSQPFTRAIGSVGAATPDGTEELAEQESSAAALLGGAPPPPGSASPRRVVVVRRAAVDSQN